MRNALQKTWSTLAQKRIIVLVFLPLVLSVLAWAAFLWGIWSFAGPYLASALSTTRVFGWLLQTGYGQWDPQLHVVSFILLTLFTLPLTYIFTMVMTSILIMPLVVSIVMKQDYADLEQKRGGSLAGSVRNSLCVGLIYLALLLLGLPLWLIPGGAIWHPLALTAWANKKIFTYDSFQDFATREEFVAIEKRDAKKLYALGFLTGAINYVPLAMLIAPVVNGILFVHYCLQSLREFRAENRT